MTLSQNLISDGVDRGDVLLAKVSDPWSLSLEHKSNSVSEGMVDDEDLPNFPLKLESLLVELAISWRVSKVTSANH